MFVLGLRGIGQCYASIHSTCVLQIKVMHEAPPEWTAARGFVDEYGDRPYDRSGWVTDCRVELDPACAEKACVDP